MIVSDIMRTKVETLDADDKLSLANDIMNIGEIRHLPVVKKGRLIGIVSQRDILKASLSTIFKYKEEERDTFLSSVVISEIMTREVVTVAPDATMAEAAELMADHKLGCLPVVEGRDKLVGIITETDILYHYVDMNKKKSEKP